MVECRSVLTSYTRKGIVGSNPTLSAMNFILDLLFPKKCVGCSKTGSYFCPTCISNIKQGELLCPNCDLAGVFGETHPFCKKTFGLDGLWSLGLYQGPLKKAIQKLKYEPSLVRDFAPVLADITVEYWKKHQPYLFDLVRKNRDKWVVVPVPLYWFRENKRGFNQSKLLGQILSKKLGLVYSEALKRIRYTRSQTKLKVMQRKKNIKNAFEVTKPYTLNPSPYVLLVDDVWTTGSTMKECCQVLKRAGAQKVWALTLAR